MLLLFYVLFLFFFGFTWIHIDSPLRRHPGAVLRRCRDISPSPIKESGWPQGKKTMESHRDGCRRPWKRLEPFFLIQFFFKRNIFRRLKLGGVGFKYFFMFTPNVGEDGSNLTHIFQMGWFNHQLVKDDKHVVFPTCAFFPGDMIVSFQ